MRSNRDRFSMLIMEPLPWPFSILNRERILMGIYDHNKREILESCRWLAENGYLGEKTSGGNISVRAAGDQAIAITPSGKPCLDLTLDDICVIDFEHNPLEGALSPSIEAAMHIGVYKHRSDVTAVVHTHQTYASVFSIINKQIPALFDEIIVEIGDMVEIIPYAFSGSAELVQNVIRKLNNNCHCYIIQNHGALCLGTSMNRAVKNTELLENVARIYYYGLLSGQKITTLSDAAIDHFSDMRKLRFK